MAARITEAGPVRVSTISTIETPDVVHVNVDFRDRGASVIAAEIEGGVLELSVMDTACPSRGLTVIEVTLGEGEWWEMSSSDDSTNFRITLGRRDLRDLRVQHYSFLDEG